MIQRAAQLFVIGLSLALAPHGLAGQDPAPPAPAPAAVPDAPKGPAPHIKFDATEVNLGDVVRGNDAVATFTYHNTGDAPLHILSAKPG